MFEKMYVRKHKLEVTELRMWAARVPLGAYAVINVITVWVYFSRPTVWLHGDHLGDSLTINLGRSHRRGKQTDLARRNVESVSFDQVPPLLW